MRLIAIYIHVYGNVFTRLCHTLVLLVFSVLLLCCNTDKNDKSTPEEGVQVARFDELSFDPYYLDASSSQETPLLLKAKFSECGEFGGHAEELQIYFTGLNKYSAKYLRYGLEFGPPPPRLNPMEDGNLI